MNRFPYNVIKTTATNITTFYEKDSAAVNVL